MRPNPGSSIRHIIGVIAMATLLLIPALLSAQNASQRAPQYTEEGTDSCLVCHSGEKMQAMMDGAHGAHGDNKTPMAQQGCESCHGPGSFHVSRAHGGAGFPPMIEFGEMDDAAPRAVQLEACLDCHSEAVAERNATPFIGSPHDTDEINCSSCHKGHVTTDLIIADMDAQAANCETCHENIRSEHNPFEGRSIDLASLACSTCHDVHAPNQD